MAIYEPKEKIKIKYSFNQMISSTSGYSLEASRGTYGGGGLKAFPGPLRSLNVKKNHIDSAVIKIFRYRQKKALGTLNIKENMEL